MLEESRLGAAAAGAAEDADGVAAPWGAGEGAAGVGAGSEAAGVPLRAREDLEWVGAPGGAGADPVGVGAPWGAGEDPEGVEAPWGAGADPEGVEAPGGAGEDTAGADRAGALADRAEAGRGPLRRGATASRVTPSSAPEPAGDSSRPGSAEGSSCPEISGRSSCPGTDWVTSAAAMPVVATSPATCAPVVRPGLYSIGARQSGMCGSARQGARAFPAPRPGRHSRRLRHTFPGVTRGWCCRRRRRCHHMSRRSSCNRCLCRPRRPAPVFSHEPALRCGCCRWPPRRVRPAAGSAGAGRPAWPGR
jgi:hypothetical protein